MRDALPHLFEHTPDLLYQLVTLVSPRELQARVAARPELPETLWGEVARTAPRPAVPARHAGQPCRRAQPRAGRRQTPCRVTPCGRARAGRQTMRSARVTVKSRLLTQ